MPIELAEDNEAVAITRCPWCGASGPDFDETPRPSDYCGHDPALIADRRTLIGPQDC